LTWKSSENTNSEEKCCYLEYRKVKKTISTETNADDYKPVFDVSSGDPALMIYGRH
jgi:hypothetical protein